MTVILCPLQARGVTMHIYGSLHVQCFWWFQMWVLLSRVITFNHCTKSREMWQTQLRITRLNENNLKSSKDNKSRIPCIIFLVRIPLNLFAIIALPDFTSVVCSQISRFFSRKNLYKPIVRSWLKRCGRYLRQYARQKPDVSPWYNQFG